MLALLLLEAAAHGVLPPPPREVAPAGAVNALEPKILFANFDGAVLTGNADCSSAPTNCSHIVMTNQVDYPAFSGTAVERQEIIDNLNRYYADFNVQIVTTRPTAAHYAMIMIGGTPDVVGQNSNYLGVGPLDCGEMNPDDITFVWSAHPALHNDPVQVAVTAAQEAAHAYGLGHTQDQMDIMYPVLVGGEVGFLNRDMLMPNDGSDCSGTGRQNSYQLLMSNVGPSAPDTIPPAISLLDPADGATLPSGFKVDFNATDNHLVTSVELWVNGAKLFGATSSPNVPMWSFTVPAGALPAGTAKIKGVASDLSGNVAATQEITVTVKALGETPGDLGTACTDTAQCNGGGYCISDSGKSFCTRACSPSNECPNGFSCTQTPQFTSICTPNASSDDSGCSAAPQGTGAGLSLLALCALALALARRRY
jgi:uncharacterized protein (TIGR03382 family)